MYTKETILYFTVYNTEAASNGSHATELLNNQRTAKTDQTRFFQRYSEKH